MPQALNQDFGSPGKLRAAMADPTSYRILVFKSADWSVGRRAESHSYGTSQLDAAGNWLTDIYAPAGDYHIVAVKPRTFVVLAANLAVLADSDTGSEGGAGAKGDKGDPGSPGAPGVDGAAATVEVGTTTIVAAGTLAEVTNSGTSAAAVLDFTIPRGAPGVAGRPGPPGTNGAAATVTIGAVSTGDAGTSAAVTNSGTASAAVLDFAIPKGDTGPPRRHLVAWVSHRVERRSLYRDGPGGTPADSSKRAPSNLCVRCVTAPITSNQMIDLILWHGGVGVSLLAAPLVLTAGQQVASTTSFAAGVSAVAGDYVTINSAQTGGTPAVNVFVELLMQ